MDFIFIGQVRLSLFARNIVIPANLGLEIKRKTPPQVRIFCAYAVRKIRLQQVTPASAFCNSDTSIG